MFGLLRSGRNLARLLRIGLALARHDALFPLDRVAGAGDKARRGKMSSRGRALIDGRGAERVVQTMAGITSGQAHTTPLTSEK